MIICKTDFLSVYCNNFYLKFELNFSKKIIKKENLGWLLLDIFLIFFLNDENKEPCLFVVFLIHRNASKLLKCIRRSRFILSFLNLLPPPSSSLPLSLKSNYRPPQLAFLYRPPASPRRRRGCLWENGRSLQGVGAIARRNSLPLLLPLPPSSSM